MKWHAARPREGREGGRQIQERSDGQARVSLTCRALAVGWAESCQEVSGWPGCNHGTQILTLITGEGGEGQRSKRNLPHFAHLLPTTLARRRERRSLTSPLPGPPSLFRARVPKCFPPGTLSSLIYTPLLCTSLARLSVHQEGVPDPCRGGEDSCPTQRQGLGAFSFSNVATLCSPKRLPNEA